MEKIRAPYSVTAFNASKHSENRMHDDTVAKKYGFAGGLVAGVEVFAYMSHLPLEAWGRAFLERGRMEGRFLKPVYDGDTAIVTATEANGGLDLRIESRGILCGSGHAALPASAPTMSIDDHREATPPPNDSRPEIGPDSYAVGAWLGIRPNTVGKEIHAQYLQDIGEGDSIYAREGILHPGILLRCANWALMQNVRLGPWIHVGSTLQQIAPGAVGDTLTVRAKVTGNSDRKGHKFVDLDALVVANGTTPLAHILHTAIYAPREVRSAGVLEPIG
jgi:acyl dehydratase